MSKALANFFDDVLLIMVIYRCTPEKSATWSSLVKEGTRYKQPIDLFLSDNTPEPQDFPFAPFINVLYQHNPDNPGVSKVYNEGCELARKQKKRWLLLLDQDTSFAEGWLEKYFQSATGGPDVPVSVPILHSGEIIISPFQYLATKGFASRTVRPGVYSLIKYFAINSGLLIDRAVFESVGGYDESIPLDFSDFAFMSKLRKNNYRLNVIDLQGQHRLSSMAIPDEDIAKRRFKQYCVGSKRLTVWTGQSFLHFLIAGGRAIRLGMQYRSTNFISIFIQSWISG
jgi:GT2 family glycosyltransferase